MEVDINSNGQSSFGEEPMRWYDPLWAAFIFFTRLPFWRLYQPPQASYRAVVEYWPLTGWLTGSVMAAVLFFGSWYLPYSLAVMLAIVARLLLTGALHEDGLADFMDGFGGGGNDRQRILAIMKDSHIGTYGVLGLGCYLLLLFFALNSLTPELAAIAILAGNPFARMLSSQLVIMMPYARTEQTAKARVVYRRMGMLSSVSLTIQGLLPLALFFYLVEISWEWVIALPALVMYFLYLMMWRKLRGYTGDCCGAVCLLTELAFYLAINLG